MISFRKPTAEEIEGFISQQSKFDVSYPEVEATQSEAPRGYHCNCVRTQLGTGEVSFAAAKKAMQRWEQFSTGWTTLYWPHTPIQTGQTVAVLARVLGVWSLNACRIVYVVEEPGPIARFGFGYGTLPGHMESGEERFLIEWDQEIGSVFYEVTAFFRPNHILTRIGWLYGLRKVNRFRIDSASAMRAAIQQSD